VVLAEVARAAASGAKGTLVATRVGVTSEACVVAVPGAAEREVGWVAAGREGATAAEPMEAVVLVAVPVAEEGGRGTAAWWAAVEVLAAPVDDWAASKGVVVGRA